MVQVISEEQEKMGGFRGGRGGGGRGGFRGGRDGGCLGLSNQDIYHNAKLTLCILFCFYLEILQGSRTF